MPCVWIPPNLSEAVNVMRCLTVGPERGAKKEPKHCDIECQRSWCFSPVLEVTKDPKTITHPRNDNTTIVL